MADYWSLFEEAVEHGKQRRYDKAIPLLRYIVSVTDEIDEAFLYLGRSYHAKGQYNAAIDKLRRFLELRPNSAAGRFFLGRSLLSAKKYRAAAQTLEEALQLRSDLVEAKSLLGYIYLKQRHSERALELLEEAVTSNPDDKQLYTGYLNALLIDGIKKFRRGDYQYVEELFRFLIERQWGGILPHLYLGMVHRIEGEYAEALSDYMRALDYSPHDELILYRIGNLLIKNGRHEEAADIFSRLEGGYEEAERRLAEGYYHRGEYSQALYYALQVLHRERGDPGMHLLAGESYREMGNYEYAENHYRRVLDSNKTHLGAFYGLALLKWQLRDYRNMLEILRKIERVEPNEELVHYYSVLCNWKLKRDSAKLLPIIQEAVRRFGPDPHLLIALADTYEREELYDPAEKWYRKVLQIGNSAVAPAYGGLISLHRKTGSIEDIDEIFEQYIQLVPDDMRARRFYIQHLYEEGEYERTIEVIEEYFASKPESDLYFQRMRAISYRKLEDYETAAELYRRLLQVEPRKEEFLRPYLFCLEKTGEIARAAETAELALSYFEAPSITISLIAGVLRYKEGKVENALACFRKATEIAPRDWRGYYNIGAIYRQKGIVEFGRKFLNRADELKRAEAQS